MAMVPVSECNTPTLIVSSSAIDKLETSDPAIIELATINLRNFIKHPLEWWLAPINLIKKVHVNAS